jgi:hypothetical protein
MEVYVVAHSAGSTYDRGCLKSHLGSNTHTYVYSSELYVYRFVETGSSEGNLIQIIGFVIHVALQIGNVKLILCCKLAMSIKLIKRMDTGCLLLLS